MLTAQPSKDVGNKNTQMIAGYDSPMNIKKRYVTTLVTLSIRKVFVVVKISKS